MAQSSSFRSAFYGDFYTDSGFLLGVEQQHMKSCCSSVNEFAVMLHVRAVKVTGQSYTTPVCKFLR